ncbi:pentatricopeptide repeat-containing protein [Senna tora]|uniref:Pentatricopeptide repeat-containing protein n=1 Tax=Senna tora TaxID=362788 RepID=A0A834XEI7_9FABA|nr:pentatricopeptide repeat-containing protein [Senna tora]
MASRALAFTLRRRFQNLGFINSDYHSPSLPSRGNLSRFLSSSALGSDFMEESSNSLEGDDDLRSRLFRLRLPKRSATNVLQRWVSEGNHITVSELRDLSRELRKSQRYKHALEISEWMVSHEEYELSDSDYAVRIDLMTKVFGIDAAERYFEGLPLSVKTTETYTALLHSYAAAKFTEKAEELYQRIKDSNLSFSALMYNEMMTLYMSVGEVEKVPLIVEDLKQHKVTPDIFTYNLWISSCAATLNIDEVRRILDEMSSDAGSNESWRRYSDLANIYVSVGHLENADSNSVVEAEKRTTQREWITYDFLVILYGGLGSKDKLDQIWRSLRMTKQKMISRNYICILSSYLILGHMKEAGEVIDQWKQSTNTEFDMLACEKLVAAFTDMEVGDAVFTFSLMIYSISLELKLRLCF